MVSPCERFVIVFNGEIYNHIAIRKALSASHLSSIQWRGHSDTETLLAGFDSFGIEKTIAMATGMFAFAVWDRHTSTLTLGRDRLGEKPLYYGWLGNSFLFGSELKALQAHPAFVASIDRGSLSLFLRHGYIPAPYSIYKDIFKLPPGTIMTLSLAQRQPVIKQYWSGAATAEDGVSHQFSGTEEDATDELEKLLTNSVGQQMVADVPLGAFLSGGVDSSTIVALMQRQSERRVKTFTIGFHEAGYNEAEYALAVA
jgi:asparagine synthase (glutamine-hydrolysing)